MLSTRFCSLCGAANDITNSRCCVCEHPLLPEVEQSKASGNTLLHDRFQVLATLGSGGFSAVYQARDIHTGQIVAIKQINLRKLNARKIIDATDTFNRELRVLSTLNHPQIPHLYDHFQDRDHWYLVLEYIAGPTLETLMEQHLAQGDSFSFAEVLTLGSHLCSVLDYLHTRQPPIIFRDLKPGNIILNSAGQPFLIDFGIARSFRHGQSRDTQSLGSPGYAAPEQYGREQTSPQSDIYSLGVLLSALLSGKDPATDTLDLTTLNLSRHAGGRAMHALLIRMLSHDPADRPADVREVASTLDAIKQDPQVADTGERSGGTSGVMWSHSAPVMSSVQKRRIPRREVVIGLGALVALVGAGIGSKALFTHLPSIVSYPSSPYSLHSVGTFSKNTLPLNGVAWSNDSRAIASCSPDMVRAWWVSNGQDIFTYKSSGDNRLNSLAWSHNGAFLALASTREGVIVLNANDGSPFTGFQKHVADVNAVCWSPDSRLIASAHTDETVQIWDAASGKNLAVYQEHQASVNAVAWSPNGLYLASADAGGIVRTWDTGSGSMFISFNWNYGHPINAVSWSPDSLYVAEASSDATVHILKNSMHSGLPFIYTGHEASVLAVCWSPDGKRIASSDTSGKILLWDAFSGKHTITFDDDSQSLNALAWSPDGRFLAAGFLNNTVKIWQVASN